MKKKKRVYSIPLFLGEGGYLQKKTNGENDPSSRYRESRSVFQSEYTNLQPRFDRQEEDCSSASTNNHNGLYHGNRSRPLAHPRGSVSSRSIGRNKSCRARPSDRRNRASTWSRPDPRSRHDQHIVLVRGG